MKPLNCSATNKCQIDISKDPGYKELLSDIKKIIKQYRLTSGKTIGKRKPKKLRKTKITRK